MGLITLNGETFPHAWIEDEEWCYCMIYQTICARADFYKTYSVRNVERYTWEETEAIAETGRLRFEDFIRISNDGHS